MQSRLRAVAPSALRTFSTLAPALTLLALVACADEAVVEPRLSIAKGDGVLSIVESSTERALIGETVVTLTGGRVDLIDPSLVGLKDRNVASTTWTSSAPSVVTAQRTSTGAMLTAGSVAGTAYVDARKGNKTTRTIVHVVRSTDIASVSVTGVPDTSMTAVVLAPKFLVTTVNGQLLETRSATWSVDTTAGQVLSDGRQVTFNRSGIRAISGSKIGRIATRSLMVRQPTGVAQLSLSASTITAGGNAVADVTFRTVAGATMQCQQVTWTANPQAGVITVQRQENQLRAIVVGLTVGTASLTASCDASASASQTVTIRSAPVDPVTPPPVVPDTGGLEMRIYRIDSTRTDSVIVSAGVPFPKGRIQDGTTSAYRVTVDGVEVPSYVAPLAGRYIDGSVRSLLVQFATTPALANRPVRLHFAGRTLSRTRVTPGGRPEAIVAPASLSDFAATGVVGKTLTRAAMPTTGHFFDYEAKFVQWEQYHWVSGDPVTEMVYYDRVLAYFAFWVRTGNPRYFQRAAVLATRYREEYIKASNFQLPEWQNNLDGLMIHYLLTGDEDSRNAILLVASRTQHAYGGPERLSNNIDHPWMDNRVQARVLNSKVLAIMLGATSSPGFQAAPGISDLRAAAASDITAILSTKNTDGGYRFYAICGQGANFMMGLLTGTLAQYHDEVSNDTRIPTAVESTIGFLATQWVPERRAFRYFTGSCAGKGGTEPANDLNGLYLSAFRWMYDRNRSASLRSMGDEAFRGGVENTWLDGPKQFNQWYQMSYRWLGIQ